MSQYPANENNQKKSLDKYSKGNQVVSIWEIVFLFGIFTFVLYILYPKEMLHRQVLSEKSNYELTGVYLQNMLRLEPANTKLMLAAANVSLERGNLDLTEKLLSVLEKESNPSIEKKLKWPKLKLLKAQIDKSINPKYIAQKNKEIAHTIRTVAQKNLFDKKDALLWYREAINMHMKEESIQFIKFLEKSDDPIGLEACVYTLTEPKYREERINCAMRLVKRGGKDAKKWLVTAWRLYTDDGNYKKAVEVLEKLSKIDASYQEELAKAKFAAGEFRQASELYMKLYKKSTSYERKKHYLLRAIDSLREGKYYEDAVRLAQKYEDLYLKDEDMSQKLIKRYLSVGNIGAARDLSTKILNKEK